MPKNINSVQAGTVQENNLNSPETRVIRGKNQFPQSFQHPSTCLYGLVDLVAVAKCEPGDVFPYVFNTDLNTFTMQSPMKSKVNMHCAAFKVPLEAIYPRNYDLMFAIPNKGDDVPQEPSDPINSTRAVLQLDRLLSSLFNFIKSPDITVSQYVRAIFLIESIISDGSLLSKMNVHLNNLVAYGSSNSRTSDYFDDWFDSVFISFLRSQVMNGERILPVDYEGEGSSDPVYFVTEDPKLLSSSYFQENTNAFRAYISFSRCVELLRSGDYVLDNRYFMDEISNLPALQISATAKFPELINIENVFAYQLACCHFFNNPKIDFIYSADLYRDNLEYLWLSAGDGVLPSFRWNSLRKFYDVASGAFLNDDHVMDFPTDQSYSNSVDFAFSFWNAIFNFQNSLRYGDYFTGARPEPIAVGDTSIDDPTNPLEVTRKLQLTRLLHKANIAGPRKDDYLRVVFGGRLPETPSDVPIRLSVQSMDVEGFEVNNTGAAQLDADSPNITTTNLRLNSERVLFEVECAEPCWLVMVQYFDAHRIYSKTTDRFAFHFDRYDDFIPDLQFFGDQEVYTAELLGPSGNLELPFAYNLRYMEYKQRYSYASGAFIRKLRSWAFVTDNLDGNPATINITPEYIRSSPSEFDRFYKSLTGWSLGNRFHFITFNTNIMAPYRQMVYAPEILA